MEGLEGWMPMYLAVLGHYLTQNPDGQPFQWIDHLLEVKW